MISKVWFSGAGSLLRSLLQRGYKKHTLDVFIHIPKTGGTTIISLFPIRRLITTSYHVTADEQLRILGVKGWGKKTSFTFVRNPWDRFVSYYCHEKAHSFSRDLNFIPFSAFAKILLQERDYNFFGRIRAGKFERYLSNQMEWITDSEGKVIVSYCARYERFQEEVQYLTYQFGKPLSDGIPHKNFSVRHLDYRTYYDDATAELVAKYYAPDIQYFNYHFD